ncbi:unnamed protein product [Didymodactylos carnosus]|uniref:Uncharacterized protein n=1 Tax=Didymodactylos carnosus TaxID=1234261 RepID=A0A8S2SX52_9BILA|nr:unnamed protein product [Didymodactylos carnosus]
MHELSSTYNWYPIAERLILDSVNSSLASLDEYRTSCANSHVQSFTTSYRSLLMKLLPTIDAFLLHCKRAAVQSKTTKTRNLMCLHDIYVDSSTSESISDDNGPSEDDEEMGQGEFLFDSDDESVHFNEWVQNDSDDFEPSEEFSGLASSDFKSEFNNEAQRKDNQSNHTHRSNNTDEENFVVGYSFHNYQPY